MGASLQELVHKLNKHSPQSLGKYVLVPTIVRRLLQWCPAGGAAGRGAAGLLECELPGNNSRAGSRNAAQLSVVPAPQSPALLSA